MGFRDGSGISWTICKQSAPRFRQITTPTPHHTTVKELKAIRWTDTHTQTPIGPLLGTTRVSRYQKLKTNHDFIEARDSEWQWHQLNHMQVCTLL